MRLVVAIGPTPNNGWDLRANGQHNHVTTAMDMAFDPIALKVFAMSAFQSQESNVHRADVIVVPSRFNSRRVDSKETLIGFQPFEQ